MIRRRTEAGVGERPTGLRRSRSKKRSGITGVVIGSLEAFDDAGVPLVRCLQHRDGSCPARTTVNLSSGDVGKEIALVFAEGDPRRPIIMGILQEPQKPGLPMWESRISVDGETVTITAENQITLRCGKASISLSRDGMIHIRGTYLVSRSSGINRIQGGSIELN
jgi:hypothetical protein